MAYCKVCEEAEENRRRWCGQYLEETVSEIMHQFTREILARGTCGGKFYPWDDEDSDDGKRGVLLDISSNIDFDIPGWNLLVSGFEGLSIKDQTAAEIEFEGELASALRAKGVKVKEVDGGYDRCVLESFDLNVTLFLDD